MAVKDDGCALENGIVRIILKCAVSHCRPPNVSDKRNWCGEYN